MKVHKYKTEHNIAWRIEEYNRIKKKHPRRIPIIIEPISKNVVFDKNKFLVEDDLTLGQFIFILKKRVNMNEKNALFLMFNDNFFPISTLMSEIWDIEKDDDNFLYGTFMVENTFG